VTFIDDHSRWTLVSFLKQKSEVFKKFKVMTKIQMRHKMKCFRCDNGGEFNQFHIENGILKQLIVPCTLQQNGFAKKKNCILVESARSITFSVVKCFGQKP
jgi:hypothetical protein